MRDTNSPAVSVLDRLLDPVSRCLNPESARSLAALQADPQAQARIGELAEKCNEGTMTPQERSEYEACVRVGDFIAILQAKARLFLKQHPAS